MCAAHPVDACGALDYFSYLVALILPAGHRYFRFGRNCEHRPSYPMPPGWPQSWNKFQRAGLATELSSYVFLYRMWEGRVFCKLARRPSPWHFSCGPALRCVAVGRTENWVLFRDSRMLPWRCPCLMAGTLDTHQQPLCRVVERLTRRLTQGVYNTRPAASPLFSSWYCAW